MGFAWSFMKKPERVTVLSNDACWQGLPVKSRYGCFVRLNYFGKSGLNAPIRYLAPVALGAFARVFSRKALETGGGRRCAHLGAIARKFSRKALETGDGRRYARLGAFGRVSWRIARERFEIFALGGYIGHEAGGVGG
jgi:hypothetical protein